VTFFLFLPIYMPFFFPRSLLKTKQQKMQSYFNGRTRRSLFFSGKESNLLKPFWLFCVKNSFKYCCYKTFYCFFSRLLWSTKKFNFLRTFKVFFCEELFIGDRIFCTGQKRDHNVIKRFFISRFHCLGNVTSFSAKIFQFKRDPTISGQRSFSRQIVFVIQGFCFCLQKEKNKM